MGAVHQRRSETSTATTKTLRLQTNLKKANDNTIHKCQQNKDKVAKKISMVSSANALA
jgi:hypothetical protein